MTPEKEAELLAEYAAEGTSKARKRAVRDELILSTIPVAKALARNYRCPSAGYEDLEAAGMLGATVAFGRFDPSRGVRFSRYAALWMTVEMSALVYRSLAVSGLRPKAGESDDIRDLKRSTTFTSADALPSRECTRGAEPDADFLMVAELRKAIDTVLSPREREVIEGMYDADGTTGSDVARRLGVSRQRIAQLEKRALRKLHEALHESV